ncbi:MAG: HEPN domain-containing protein [Thermoprotei archaeon]
MQPEGMNLEGMRVFINTLNLSGEMISMSSREAALLKRRAEAFLRNAQSLFESGDYDLAMFSLEQHCQLLVKYYLFYLDGTYPRTHSLTQLLRELAKHNEGVSQLLHGESYLYVTKLEDAYVASRYIPREYDREEVGPTLRFVKEVFDPVVQQAGHA